MEQNVDQLVQRYEKGAITRRELIAALAALCAAPAAAVAQSSAQAEGPIPIGGFDHLAFRVADIERSTAFYLEHLGGRIRSQSPGAVFIELGSHWLALFSRGTLSTGHEPAQFGVDHISFDSTKFRSLAERMGALRARGLNPFSPPGTNRVYFRDPDGIILQLS